MAGTPFSVVGGITRSITLFDFAVTYLKDLKTPTVDILDYIEDSTANSILPVWDATYEYAAEDKIDEPYASFDLGDKLFNEVFGVSTVTGSHDYVSFTIWAFPRTYSIKVWALSVKYDKKIIFDSDL